MKLDDLLKGKATTIKGVNYLSTADYVNPFIEKMSRYTDDFIIQVREPNQITRNNDSDDITYNRVYIQAVLPDVLDQV